MGGRYFGEKPRQESDTAKQSEEGRRKEKSRGGAANLVKRRQHQENEVHKGSMVLSLVEREKKPLEKKLGRPLVKVAHASKVVS